MPRTSSPFHSAHRLLFVVGVLSFVSASVPVMPLGVERLPNGNTMIADGRIFLGNDAHALEVDSLGRLVWAYIKCDVPFLHTARRLPNGNTLMSASTGDRVIEVNRDGETVWEMSSGLDYPNEAYRLANGNTLITDRDNGRVIEVTPQHDIVWSRGGLNGPHNGNRLANGHTLVCDGDNDRVIEVDSSGAIVWQYGTGLSWARCVQRLPNGHTLIADSHHDRVIEVDTSNAVVWSATGLLNPYTAQRLANGNTLVSAGARVVELDPDRNEVWQYPNTVPVFVETLKVVNSGSGCTLYVHIHRPADAGPEHRVPGVVFAPGGTGFGGQLDATTMPDDIASEGFAFLHFDPDGRGQSGPQHENYGGYVHQDGLHSCLSYLASRDYVDTSRLGIYAWRYGITIASGAIARHPEPRVKFLLDFEGPAARQQTCRDSGGFIPVTADSESFWQEREAARFIKSVPAAYLRFQTLIDSQPGLFNNLHAVQLVDSATAVEYGGAGMSGWTRVNDSVMNPPNRVYTVTDPPAWVPEIQEVQNYLRALIYLHELADMDLSVAAAEPRVRGPVASLRAAPRPCRGKLEVELPPGRGQRELRVHDTAGRLVASVDVPAARNEAALDLSHLRPGVYYVSTSGAGAVPVVVVR